MELDKNRKQLEVLQMEIGKTLLGDSLYTPNDLQEAIKVIKKRIFDGEEQLAKLDSEMGQKKEMVEAVLPAYRRYFDQVKKCLPKMKSYGIFSMSLESDIKKSSSNSECERTRW